MRIKVVGVSSSPHENGSTSFLVSEVLHGAQQAGAEVEEIWLPNYDIRHCRGCFRCMAEGKCPIDDDFEWVKTKLREADGLVIGSPTYGMAPNSLMKALMDRLGMLNVYTGGLSDKYVVGVSSAGAVGAGKVARELTKVVDGFFQNGKVSGTVSAQVGWGRAQDLPHLARKATSMGERMVKDIRDRKQHPFQKIGNKLVRAFVLRRIMRDNVIANKDLRMKAVYDELIRKGIIAH